MGDPDKEEEGKNDRDEEERSFRKSVNLTFEFRCLKAKHRRRCDGNGSFKESI